MQVKRTRTLKEVLHWTRWDILYLTLVSSFPVTLYFFTAWKWLTLPWLPIALIGTAVSFIVGFKNNASYDRAWEARKIWGSIVNGSRSFINGIEGYLNTQNLSTTEQQDILKHSVNLHIAWLTALRFQLRETRQWESIHDKSNAEVRKFFYTEETSKNIFDELQKYLGKEKLIELDLFSNRATHILKYQTQNLKQLKEKELISELNHIELQNYITEFYTQQGACERIKNYPYPRQFATLNSIYIRIFTLLLPFGLVFEFEKMFGHSFLWLTIPFSVLVGWIFTTMEKVGDTSENPFEAGANDIPITQISRNIEIDLLELINEPHNLTPIKEIFGVIN